MKTARTLLGEQAETLACDFLRRRGLKILDRNWRRPWGELDIVAKQGSTIHFVEVKASKREYAGFEPIRRADGWKMHKVARTAQTWLSANRYPPDTEWQLDVISVIMEPELTIELIEQAQ
jgi:putative endonuclease